MGSYFVLSSTKNQALSGACEKTVTQHFYTCLGPFVIRGRQNVCTTFYKMTVKSFILHFFLYLVLYFTVGPRFQIIKLRLFLNQHHVSFCLPEQHFSPFLWPSHSCSEPSDALNPFLTVHTLRREISSWLSTPGAQGSAGPLGMLEVLLVPVSLFVVTIYCIFYFFCYRFANLSEGPKV